MVPSWMTAVNAAPGSDHPASFGTMSRCAELEIGRNSVSPWTMPRMVACSTSMVRTAYRLGLPRNGSAICRAERSDRGPHRARHDDLGPRHVGRGGHGTD